MQTPCAILNKRKGWDRGDVVWWAAQCFCGQELGKWRIQQLAPAPPVCPGLDLPTPLLTAPLTPCTVVLCYLVDPLQVPGEALGHLFTPSTFVLDAVPSASSLGAPGLWSLESVLLILPQS